MKIIRGHQAGATSAEGQDYFTGKVQLYPANQPADGPFVMHVNFEPGARTHWHTHEHGQVLHVLAGQGVIYDRDGNGGTIGTGDTIWIEPGLEHWHGADADSYCVHLAVALGQAEWLGEVSEEDYTRHPRG